MPDTDKLSAPTTSTATPGGVAVSESPRTQHQGDTRRESFDSLPARLQPGDRLEKWWIGREICSGATASVFEANGEGLRFPLAVKVLSSHLTLVDRAVRRFRVEADLLSRLRHPYIVEFVGSGEDRGYHYYVMRRETSLTARDLRHTEGLSSTAAFLRRVVTMFRGLAEALAAAHELGIVHRDVKPENLLLSPEGELILSDFGSALDSRTRDPELESCLWGTLRYMSPDQFLSDADPYDPRIDVYGLGLSLYEVVTGQCPVPRGDEDEIAEWKLSQKLPDARRVQPEVSLGLERVLRRATARRPGDRYQNPGEFARALRRLQPKD